MVQWEGRGRLFYTKAIAAINPILILEYAGMVRVILVGNAITIYLLIIDVLDDGVGDVECVLSCSYSNYSASDQF